jgi:benzoyl-CoA-dihydrodiol lyase
MAEFNYPPISFQTDPSSYRHWQVRYEEEIAHVILNVDIDQPMWADRYELKSNSYDLSVDIELNDIVQRMRFEHPEVRAVLVESSQDKLFCAGANIPMLGGSPHAFKVNFCKYTNETRCGLEDASANSGQIWIAALNGTAAGGGYELALACEHIYLIDDGNSAVSLPEVPLLGVLPGTGGLTRLTDKRKIRRDISDLFCTKAEGFRARDAKRYRLIDGSFPKSKWVDGMNTVAKKIASTQPIKEGGMILPTISSEDTENTWQYTHLDVVLDLSDRNATITIYAPTKAPERSTDTWALAMYRELEDALLRLRFNHLSIGLLLFKSQGDQQLVLEHEDWVADNAPNDWFVNEILLFQKRTLGKVDNMSKSMFALIEENHCFVGTLFEICLACDRTYMFLDEDLENTISLTEANKGRFLMSNGNTRIQQRFLGEPKLVEEILDEDDAIDAERAEELGLVTASLDDIDYEGEVRIAIEERVSLSPDALTGMEQNLRFGGSESCETKIYGRLSAWQNWIFQRPNAVGERGALTMYGQPELPSFDYRRT